MPANSAAGQGTKEKPWTLKTPSGSSEYVMYKDETLDPPAIVCVVGKTELRYHLRAIEDLHAMLKKHGTGCPSGAPMSRSRRPQAPSRNGAGHQRTRSRAGTDRRRASAAASGCTCRRCSRRSVSPRSRTTRRTIGCERRDSPSCLRLRRCAVGLRRRPATDLRAHDGRDLGAKELDGVQHLVVRHRSDAHLDEETLIPEGSCS